MKIKKQITDLFRANKVYLLYICKSHWYIFILQFFNIIVGGVSAAILSQSSKAFIASIINDRDIVTAMIPIVFVSIYTLFMHALRYITNIYSHYAFSKANAIVKKEMAKKISNLRLSYYDSPENKDVLSRAIKFSDTGGSQLLNYFISLLTNIVGILSLIVVLTPFDWWVSFLLIGLTLYRSLFEVIISKKNYNFDKKHTLLNRKVSYFSGILFNPLQILDINIYGVFDFFFKKYKENQDENIELVKTHTTKINLLNLLSIVSLVIQNIVLYSYIGYELLQSTITIADFTLFFAAVNSFNSILNNIKKSLTSFLPMVLEAQNYIEFLNTSEEELYFSDRKKEELLSIDSIRTIEFRNVSFHYPNKDNYVIRNTSFLISEGEKVSLVGVNGAGKSTLIKLILGFYIPSEGEILINGISLKKINLDSYWKLFGTMFQQTSIYALSAYENITLQNDQNDIDNVQETLAWLGLNTRFSKEKNGIFSELSRKFDKDGTKLSGGEAQKVAFARACFNERPVLILDEPSSALDAKSENELYQYVEDYHHRIRNNIVMFVSHRLSSSVNADKILVLGKGSLLDVGNHNELMERCEEYRTLFVTQAKQYTKKTNHLP